MTIQLKNIISCIKFKDLGQEIYIIKLSLHIHYFCLQQRENLKIYKEKIQNIKAQIQQSKRTQSEIKEKHKKNQKGKQNKMEHPKQNSQKSINKNQSDKNLRSMNQAVEHYKINNNLFKEKKIQNQNNKQFNKNNKEEKQQKKIRILVISEVHKQKIYNEQSISLANYAINLMNELYDGFQFFSNYLDEFPLTHKYCKSHNLIDFILTVGNNSTLMYTFYKFQQVDTPPILGFSVEGQSTLFNYTKCDIDSVIKQFVNKIKQNSINKCMEQFSKIQLIKQKDQQIIVKNSTCQIQISRGSNPGLVKMQLFLKNKSNEEQIFISKLWGDGLVVSTAYGSVARSMLLNGPIIHKKIQSILLTPVCPLSLKFRPIVLPTYCDLIIKIQQNSRAGGTVYIDGIKTDVEIKPGERIVIKKSQIKTNLISNLNGSYEQILFQNLQQFLSWGQEFSSLEYKKNFSKKLI